MGWLDRSDDEVAAFHPAFESVANDVLKLLGEEAAGLEWVHHIRTPGSSLVPDYVLRESESGAWLLAVELKRTRDDVFSTRYQLQAKGYAEDNANQFRHDRSRYFAVSNLEVSLLFALNGSRPPKECRVSGGTYRSGDFDTDAKESHIENLRVDLVALVTRVIRSDSPAFETIWPRVSSVFHQHVAQLPFDNSIGLERPSETGWHLVEDYFADGHEVSSRRVFLLRTLLADYLRGMLFGLGHSFAPRLVPMQPTAIGAAIAVESIQAVDFASVFEPAIGTVYRNLENVGVSAALEEYLRELLGAEVARQATKRSDAPELLDAILFDAFPPEVQDERGKVQTDFELARILACLSITSSEQRVVDPCAGDGQLLLAAHDWLRHLGCRAGTALQNLAGVEADPFSIRLAASRIALRAGRSLDRSSQPTLIYGDLFTNATPIAEADVVLMNPPFRRYEAQDERPVPQELREHYDQMLTAEFGSIDLVDGQSNLYLYYIEFVGKAMKDGATMGLILDNKWYHSRSGESLRRFLMKHFEIVALVEYPHSAFFQNVVVGTSILVARRVSRPGSAVTSRFVRCRVDPRTVDLDELSRAINGGLTLPFDWGARDVRQADLDPKTGWKPYFSPELKHEFRIAQLPQLGDLFRGSRRGSLAKEEGGVSVLSFPIGRPNYGSVRASKQGTRRSFETTRKRRLTSEENAQLSKLSKEIPKENLGYALNRSNFATGYALSENDVLEEPTLEAPLMRQSRHSGRFGNARRAEAGDWLSDAINELESDPPTRDFLDQFQRTVGLQPPVLTIAEIWVSLREPYAGELIIPRKMRAGHRVHVNPFAMTASQRQVRLSSNFVSFSDCVALDQGSGISRSTAVELIAAFLVSSFGQLQFELEGVNREGLLSLEAYQMKKIRVVDPRAIEPGLRASILEAWRSLPYPIPTNQLCSQQPERIVLDELFATQIASLLPQTSAADLLAEVHEALDEWVLARQP